MKNLEEELTIAIKNKKFSFFEMTGFRTKPDLALLAGTTIGYKVALDWVNNLMEEEKKNDGTC